MSKERILTVTLGPSELFLGGHRVAVQEHGETIAVAEAYDQEWAWMRATEELMFQE